MNIAFSKILKIGERKFEFNFRKRPAPFPYYHVDVTDERGIRISFTMTKTQDEGWNSEGTTVPLWVVASQTSLGKAIDEEEIGFNSDLQQYSKR